MRILIVEPEATGHRMVLYVRILIQEIIRRGWDFILMTTKKATEHESYNIVKTDIGREIDVVLMDEVKIFKNINIFTLIARQYFYYNAFKKKVIELKKCIDIDYVYLMSFEYCDKIISIKGSPFNDIPFGGMFVSIKFHHYAMGLGRKSRNDYFYEKMLHFMLRCKQLKICNYIDEVYDEYVAKRNIRKSNKMIYVPDIGELKGCIDKNGAREILKIKEETFIVLVYGTMTKRKGVANLFLAINEMVENRKIVVLLAGKQDEYIKNLLKSRIVKDIKKKAELIVYDKFLNEEEEYVSFKVADAVWLGYDKVFSGASGVMVQAASLGIPVIASKYGVVGWTVKKYGIGELIDPEDKVGVANVLKKIIKYTCQGDVYAGNCFRYAKMHDVKKYQERICESIIKGVIGGR